MLPPAIQEGYGQGQCRLSLNLLLHLIPFSGEIPHWLRKFWTAICNDEVQENNRILAIGGGATWDDDITNRLYIRDCYSTFRNEIPHMKYALILGTNGIEKSLMLYYFIYGVVK
jgi:hypothetical protein